MSHIHFCRHCGRPLSPRSKEIDGTAYYWYECDHHPEPNNRPERDHCAADQSAQSGGG